MISKKDFKKISDWLWEIPKGFRADMRVPARVYLSEKMLEEAFRDRSIEQLINVSTLPGIQKYALAMPDMHEGYSSPIGGVAAIDTKEGIISPGMQGYDINCGVRVLTSEWKESDLRPYLEKLANEIYKEVPSGLGKGRQLKFSIPELDKILEGGVPYLVEQGYGEKEDIENCEAGGRLPWADAKAVSNHAKNRGRDQVGTLGSGNHFLEIQKVAEIFNEEVAKIFGLFKDQMVIMVHCLPGEAKILLDNGSWMKIEDLEKNWSQFKVKVLNLSTHQLEDTKIIKFIKSKPYNKIFKIKTKSGREIVATEDHPLFTPTGLKLIHEIEEGEKIGILPFEGVQYEQPGDEIIVGEKEVKEIIKKLKLKVDAKKVITQLKKRNLLPLKYNSPHLPLLTKLLGFITGDGWIGLAREKNRQRLWLKIIGKPEDLEEIRKDIEKLGYSVSKTFKLFCDSLVKDINGHERHIKGTTHQIATFSIALPLLFLSLGAPFGNKSKIKFSVPKWIFKAPLWIKRLYLAGYFGAEMRKPDQWKKQTHRFQNPTISLNKVRRLKQNGIKFLKDIKNLLEEFGVKSTKILVKDSWITNKDEQTVKIILRISSKGKNLINLWSMIGYEYNKERSILAAQAVQYLYLKNALLEKESSITKKPKKKLSVTNFLSRRIFYPTFSEFVTAYKLNPPSPVIWDVVEKKEEIKDFKGFVYDLRVEHKDHNFVADCFIVGNCGSRGLGHQVCSDYLREFIPLMLNKYKIKVPDREFACVPFDSPEGKKALAASGAAANYAWANRQMITHFVRKAWKNVLGDRGRKLALLYDVAHNIIKIEKYKINGKEKEVAVHRKGATRAFPPGHPEIPEKYRSVGQPVIIPGSMGTASYILVGTKEGEEAFYSTCHGAGRTMSRHAAIRSLSGREIINQLERKGIVVKCYSLKGIAEEAPQAYKNVDEVVEVVHNAGLSKKVVKLLPLAVIKGE
jgi:tRNA-splicing ligase RtcB